MVVYPRSHMPQTLLDLSPRGYAGERASSSLCTNPDIEDDVAYHKHSGRYPTLLTSRTIFLLKLLECPVSDVLGDDWCHLQRVDGKKAKHCAPAPAPTKCKSGIKLVASTIKGFSEALMTVRAYSGYFLIHSP